MRSSLDCPLPLYWSLIVTTTIVPHSGHPAVIGMRYDATEVMEGVTEVLRSGTAVGIAKIAS
jgi:uncharacterized protein YbjQ (UPF0145 family)